MPTSINASEFNNFIEKLFDQLDIASQVTASSRSTIYSVFSNKQNTFRWGISIGFSLSSGKANITSISIARSPIHKDAFESAFSIRSLRNQLFSVDQSSFLGALTLKGRDNYWGNIFASDGNLKDGLKANVESKLIYNSVVGQYAVIPSSTTVNEGSAVNILVSTTDIAVNSPIYWRMTGEGVDANDFTINKVEGQGIIDSSGRCQLSIQAVADKKKEGDEIAVVCFYSDKEKKRQVGEAASITIKDTSKGGIGLSGDGGAVIIIQNPEQYILPPPPNVAVKSLSTSEYSDFGLKLRAALNPKTLSSNLLTNPTTITSSENSGLVTWQLQVEYDLGGVLLSQATVKRISLAAGDTGSAKLYTVIDIKGSNGSAISSLSTVELLAKLTKPTLEVFSNPLGFLNIATKNAVFSSPYATLFDSVAGKYQVLLSASSVTEGQQVVATIKSSGLLIGSQLYWKASGIGINEDDFANGTSLSGTITVSDGTPTSITLRLKEDRKFEGDEILNFALFSDSSYSNKIGSSGTVLIKDTSVPSPEYSAFSDKSSYSEGETVNITINSKYVPQGTTLYWSIGGTGINTKDFTNIPIASGQSVVGSDGRAAIQLILANDLIVEGQESLVIDIFSDKSYSNKVASSTAVVADTSVPTYALETSADSVEEGNKLTVNVVTSGVREDTLLKWRLTNISEGVSKDDFYLWYTTNSGLPSGKLTVNQDGRASFDLFLSDTDSTSEGPEEFLVELLDSKDSTIASKKIRIIDTQKPKASIQLFKAKVFSDDSNGYRAERINNSVEERLPYDIRLCLKGMPNLKQQLYWRVVDNELKPLGYNEDIGVLQKYSPHQGDILGYASTLTYPVSGTFAVDGSNNSASSLDIWGPPTGIYAGSIWIKEDSLTEGDENFWLQVSRKEDFSNVLAASPFTIKDTSRDGYWIALKDSVKEGGDINILFGKNTVSSSPEKVFWKISGAGINAEDFQIQGLTGSILLSKASASKNLQGDLMLKLAADLKTEGIETATVEMYSDESLTKKLSPYPATFSIIDSSPTPVVRTVVESPTLSFPKHLWAKEYVGVWPFQTEVEHSENTSFKVTLTEEGPDEHLRATQSSKNVVIYIHGWKDTSVSAPTRNILDALYTSPLYGQNPNTKYKIFNVNWPGACIYESERAPYRSASLIDPVARELTTLIKSLNIDPSKLTLIGHSLGSYVACKVAASLNAEGKKVDKVIGLDPADNDPPTQKEYDTNWENGHMYFEGSQNGRVIQDNVVDPASLNVNSSIGYVVSDEERYGLAGDNDIASKYQNSYVVDFQKPNIVSGAFYDLADGKQHTLAHQGVVATFADMVRKGWEIPSQIPDFAASHAQQVSAFTNKGYNIDGGGFEGVVLSAGMNSRDKEGTDAKFSGMIVKDSVTGANLLVGSVSGEYLCNKYDRDRFGEIYAMGGDDLINADYTEKVWLGKGVHRSCVYVPSTSDPLNGSTHAITIYGWSAQDKLLLINEKSSNYYRLEKVNNGSDVNIYARENNKWYLQISIPASGSMIGSIDSDSILGGQDALSAYRNRMQVLSNSFYNGSANFEFDRSSSYQQGT